MLLFAIEPITQQLYFLLGNQTKLTQGTNKVNYYTYFTGAPQAGEGHEEAAARECLEETLYCVDMLSEVDSSSLAARSMSKELNCVSNMLLELRYNKKIKFTQRLTTKEGKVVVKCVCYLKQIKWDPYIPTRFQKRFELLRNLKKRAAQQTHHKALYEAIPYSLRDFPAINYDSVNCTLSVDDSYLEVGSVVWLSAEKVKQMLVLHKQGNHQRLFRGSCVTLFSILCTMLDEYKRKMLTCRGQVGNLITRSRAQSSELDVA